MGVIPWSPLAGGWLSGEMAQGPGRAVIDARAAAARPAMTSRSRPTSASSTPSRQLALLAEEAGISLIHLALAFVIRHPAVTAAIIGPRTIEQLESQLGAVAVELSDDVLDRIDEIVPPGTNFSQADAGWINPDLEPAARRERAQARAARTF